MAEKLCELKKSGADGGGWTETVLWTNPDLDVPYTSTSITLNSSVAEYDYLKFEWRFRGSSTDSHRDDLVPILILDTSEYVQSNSTTPSFISPRIRAGSLNWSRTFYYVSDTEVYMSVPGGSGSITNGAMCIPKKIIGIKL